MSLPAGWRKRPARPERTGHTATAPGATSKPGARLRAQPLIPVLPLALVPAIFFGLGTRSESPCGPAIRPQRTAAALSPLKTCPSNSQVLVHQRLPNG